MNWAELQDQAIYGVLLLGCLSVSFLLSGMEAGVLALSRWRIRQQMRAGKRSAAALNRFLENTEDFLWTILVGNTLATFIAYSMIIVALYVAVGRQPLLFAVIFGVLAVLLYTFADLLPKMLFRAFPNRFCMAVAIPFRLIHAVLSPLVLVMRRISDAFLAATGGKGYSGHLFGSRSELRLMVEDASNELTSEERGMILRVLDLQHLRVGHIMVALERVTAVEAETPGREVLRICRETGYSRLPVWQPAQGEASRRRIAGIVSLRSMLYSDRFDPKKPARDYVKPALYLREDLRVEDALRRMQRSGQRLAIVLGLDQREIGIVSLQDMLRSIFGEVNL